MKRICPVCSGNEWSAYFHSKNGKIMTGDQRIGEGKLDKVICNGCGVVSNKDQFTDQELETLYGEEYELNTYGREEHLFFTENGPIPRSQVFADWITPHFNISQGKATEVGCGEGLLLQKMQKNLPEIKFKGIDGSAKAISLAKAKKLDVRQALILNKDDVIEQSDVIFLMNVIEHVEDLDGTIEALKNSITEKGRIIFCLPIQEFGGYDIVFAEHVWHFTTEHFKKVLNNNGLSTIHQDSKHPINHGIGLFVCEKSVSKVDTSTPNETLTLSNTRDYWNRCFNEFNELIEGKNLGRVAVFGSGEVLTLFLTFSNLQKCNIVASIDQTPSKIGTTKHNIPIEDIDWLEKNSVDAVILCLNQKYYDVVKEKLSAYNIELVLGVYS